MVKRLNQLEGKVYLVGDEVRAETIVARAYATFDLGDAAERAELAATAFASLHDQYGPFIPGGETRSVYSIIIAGELFGAGGGARHAAVALSEAGVIAVIAASFGDDFERLAVNEGLFLPVQAEAAALRSCRSRLSRGDDVSINLESMTLRKGAEALLSLAPLGVKRTIVDAGGLAAFLKMHGPPQTD